MEAGLIAVQALVKAVPQGDSPIKQTMLDRNTKFTSGAMKGFVGGLPKHMPVLKECLQAVACLLRWGEAVTKLGLNTLYANLPWALGVGVRWEDTGVIASACHCMILLKGHWEGHVGKLWESKTLGTHVVQALDVVVGQEERDLQEVARVCGAVVVLLEGRREERATLRRETAEGMVQVLKASAMDLVGEAIGVLARRSEGCMAALSRAGAVEAVEGMRERPAWARGVLKALQPPKVQTEGRRQEGTEQQSKRRKTE
jgi:hypothetical protein